MTRASRDDAHDAGDAGDAGDHHAHHARARGRVRARRSVVVVALFVLAGATSFCVFPDPGVGRPCEEQSACSTGHVCVRLDPEDEGEGNVCLPMLELDAPQACTADEDCAAAGFPVDAFCQDGFCTCGDVDDGFTCDSFDTTEVVGEHTCRCLPALLVDGDECIDDNQCVSLRCGNGNCVEGVDGDGCDADEDCAFSANATCAGGTCE